VQFSDGKVGREDERVPNAKTREFQTQLLHYFSKSVNKSNHHQEGSSSNRPELAAFVLALRGTPATTPMLYLCDNQALQKAVKRWVGEGGKATLVRALDADILSEAIKELWKRTTAGAATFLIKVKAHRGEPANKKADIQADKAISGKDVPTEWHDRTNSAVFKWQEPQRKGGTVSYEDWKSTWNIGVQKVIRRGSAVEEVHKHRDRVTGAWKQISKQRRQVDVSHDPSMVMALQHGNGWMRKVSKRLVSKRRKKGEASTSLSTVHRQRTSCWNRMQESLYWGSIWVTKKSHGSKADDWGWRWQEIRQQPVFWPKQARCNQQGVGFAE